LEPLLDTLLSHGLRVAFLNREDHSPQVIQRVGPDLLLLNLNGSDGRAVNLCRELKRTHQLRDLPVVFITRQADLHTRIQAIRSGAVDVLSRELVAPELIARMEAQIAIYRLHQRLLEELEARRRDLEQAREIQLAVIPRPEQLRDLQHAYGVELSCYYHPSEQLGGDFFDLFAIDRDTLGGFLADFSGHGVQAALHTFSLKTFWYREQNWTNPERLLRELNDFYRELLPAEHFLTLTLFSLSPRRRTLSVWFQGGPPLFMVSGQTGEVREYHIPNTPLGLAERLEVEELRLEMEVGDTLVLLSDGILDSRGSGEGITFHEVILEEMARLTHLPPGRFIDHLVERAKQFAKPRRLEDDLTAVVVRLGPQGPRAAAR